MYRHQSTDNTSRQGTFFYTTIQSLIEFPIYSRLHNTFVVMETGWRLYVCTVKQPRKCMAVFLKRLCLLKFMSWKTSHTVFVKDFCLNFQILIWLFFFVLFKKYIFLKKMINNQRVLLLKVCCLVLLYQIRFSGSCFLILIFI